jgi:hypothetical protein
MQHTLKTESGEYLVVDVPEGSENIKMSEDHIGRSWLEYPNSYGCEKIPLPVGNYEIIGLHPGITEEQAAGIVEKMSNEFYIGYKDYRKEISAFHSALESLDSLLEANRIYTVNPIQDPKKQIGKYYDPPFDGEFIPSPYSGTMLMNKYREDIEKWQAAEDRTSKLKIILEKL